MKINYEESKHKSRYLELVIASVVLGLFVLLSGSEKALSDPVEDSEWASYGRTHDQTHFSPLLDINVLNVAELGLAWSYDIPGTRLPWSVPLEVGGNLYVATGYSVVRAIDATNGRVLWIYDPDVPGMTGSKLLPGLGVRGIASWKNRIFVGTQDGRLVSIDAKTGKPVWSVATIEPNEPRSITGPPLVFNGKVMIGHGGAESGAVRGYVTAYDAETGKQLWRFFTVPGNPGDGFENQAMKLAAKTWHGQWWKYGGGGTVWNAMAYDSELNRVYIGTSNGSPWNQKIRSPGGGDNLFLTALVALDADNGTYAWHYQTNPGDVWDFDASTDIELAHLVVNGKFRRVLMQASKNGFFYVIDRDTGRLISAEKYAKVTWAEKIDSATGRPVEAANARYKSGKTIVWPGTLGAHGVQPMAFNSITKLVYIPTYDLSEEFNDKDINFKTWKFDRPDAILKNLGVNIKLHIPPNTSETVGISSLLAWNPIEQRVAWRVKLPGVFNGGIASTAGNLVFQGRCDGKFLAYAADSGKELWSFDSQAGILGAPITYKIGNRQYVSVVAGSGGWRTPPQRLLTFALGGNAQLPSVPHIENDIVPVSDPNFQSNVMLEQHGAEAFQRCVACHGPNAISRGDAPDLRASSAILNESVFLRIVKAGTLRAQGMPPFTDLSEIDLDSIRQYLRSRARDLRMNKSSTD